jgi:hypothetical protein
MTREDLVEATGDDELLFADGFDDPIIGFAKRCGQPTLVVYDREKCIDILIAGGASPEEAEEHFEFNVEGSWVGERTPLYLVRPVLD